MALLYIDSFDHYLTADLNEKWTSTTTSAGGACAISSGNGRRSTSSLRCTHPTAGGGSALMSKTVTSSGAVCIAGFSVNVSLAPSATAGSALFRVADSGSNQWSLVLLSDFKLAIKQGGVAGTTVATSSVTGMSVGVTAYVEVKVTIHNTAGTADIRVNGVSVLSATSLNTRSTANNTYNGFGLGVSNNAFNTPGTTDIDDFYLMDGSGSSPWTDFLGDCRVDACRPTGAGATTGFTPLAGSNFQNVDDTTPDDDSTYNSAAAASVTDTFVTDNLPATGSEIFGVQVVASVKKTDAGTCSVAPVVRHSGSDNVGTTVASGTAYTYQTQTYQTNPGTSAQWTESDFNAAEFGYRRTA